MPRNTTSRNRPSDPVKERVQSRTAWSSRTTPHRRFAENMNAGLVVCLRQMFSCPLQQFQKGGNMTSPMRLLRVVWFSTAFSLLIGNSAVGSGKVGVYAIRMVPYGQDAETYSRPSWGGGIHAVFPLPVVSQLFAITGGLEFVNFLGKKIELREPTTGLRVDQKTSQDFVRLFVGGQIGGHGNGFLRPHAGASFALAHCLRKMRPPRLCCSVPTPFHRTWRPPLPGCAPSICITWRR